MNNKTGDTGEVMHCQAYVLSRKAVAAVGGLGAGEWRRSAVTSHAMEALTSPRGPGVLS